MNLTSKRNPVKKIVLSLMFLFSAVSLLAQNKQKHQTKHYVDSLGMLYWNKHQPFYLRIATSPTDTGMILESKSHAKYVNPAYFDTEGSNFIRTRYAVDPQTKKAVVPQQEVLWEIQVDGIAPKVEHKFIGAERFVTKDKIYYGKGLKVVLSAKDQLSGVENIYFTKNNEASTTYSQKILFQEEGSQTLTTYALDNVGNAGEKDKTMFYVDHTPPVTAHDIEGEMQGNIIEKNAVMRLKSEDELSGIKKVFYKITEDEFLPYGGQRVPLKKLKDGNYTIDYYSIDQVGNKEEVRSFNFYIDKLPPILASDILGDRFIVDEQIYFSGRTKLKLTAVDNKSGVKEVRYSIDGSDFGNYDQPFYLPSVPGLHVIRYYAVDNMKNRTGSYERVSSPFQEYRHNVSKIYVDLTGPTLKYSFIGDVFKSRDTVFVNTKTRVKLMATDAESGLQYKSYSINGVQAETKYTQPFNLTREGENIVEVFGYDNVNNRNRDQFLVMVDDSGPEIIGTFSILPLKEKQGFSVYPKHTILYLAATDNIIGTDKISYSLNGSPVRMYKGAVKGFKRKTLNTIKIFAVDKLKNKNEKEIKFYLE